IIGNGLPDGTSSVGGVVWDAAYVLVENSLIAGNIGESGGGLSAHDGALDVIGSTIAYNVATQGGGAGINASTNLLGVENSLIWQNVASGMLHQGAQIAFPSSQDDYTISYTNVQGWNGYYGGMENFGLDPVFTDPEGPDGIPGTEDDDLRVTPDSPCINRGDPAFVPLDGELDLDRDPRVKGCRVDVGAYESDAGLASGDYDIDRDVDLRDFAEFQDCFRASDVNSDGFDTCLCTFDLHEDGVIDSADYAVFWTLQIGP
ncbi:MAG: hypothetical protein JSU63_11475, partial [Phycisphaerales bacterium]